ncbi:MAG TPA: TIGR03013 family XrtA/PEP-CTERM system glycosyltransferase [Bryobacteraceae bacterium]|jgi:sugar transferase (PEP-CTERM system associated)
MIRLFNQYVALKSVLLVALESVIVTLSLIGAASLRFWGHPSQFQSMVLVPFFAVKALVVVITIQMCCYYNNLYDFHTFRRRQEELIGLGQSEGQACVLLGLLYFAVPDLMLGRGILLIAVLLAGPLIAACRAALDSSWSNTALKQNVLILGSGDLAGALACQFTSRADLNLCIVGFLQAGRDPEHPASLAGYKLLGEMKDLTSAVRNEGVDKIIVALDERRQVLPVHELVRLRMEGIVVEDAQTAMTALSGRVMLDTVQPIWFVFSRGFRRSTIMLAVKRFLDIVCATLGLILTAPIMALTAVVIVLDSGWPVFYQQRRVGLGKRCFNILKFRSMTNNAEGDGARWASAGDQRVTRVGRFLRKYRLDEFPQFINVLRGDMSFVGPRPERPEFVEQLRKEILYYDERHTVRPGITGWAQVQYDYGGSVEAAYRKLEYDLFYLQNMSAIFDIMIIVQSVRTVLSGKGGR